MTTADAWSGLSTEAIGSDLRERVSFLSCESTNKSNKIVVAFELFTSCCKCYKDCYRLSIRAFGRVGESID